MKAVKKNDFCVYIIQALFIIWFAATGTGTLDISSLLDKLLKTGIISKPEVKPTEPVSEASSVNKKTLPVSAIFFLFPYNSWFERHYAFNIIAFFLKKKNQEIKKEQIDVVPDLLDLKTDSLKK